MASSTHISGPERSSCSAGRTNTCMALRPHRHAPRRSPAVRSELDEAQNQLTDGGEFVFVKHAAALGGAEEPRFKCKQVLVALQRETARQSPFSDTPEKFEACRGQGQADHAGIVTA